MIIENDHDTVQYCMIILLIRSMRPQFPIIWRYMVLYNIYSKSVGTLLHCTTIFTVHMWLLPLRKFYTCWLGYADIWCDLTFYTTYVVIDTIHISSILLIQYIDCICLGFCTKNNSVWQHIYIYSVLYFRGTLKIAGPCSQANCSTNRTGMILPSMPYSILT